MATLKINDASAQIWELELVEPTVYSIGRSAANQIVLRDPRVSRFHAQIKIENGDFVIVDGFDSNGEWRRSGNRVFVNNLPISELRLADADEITIGDSKLLFENKPLKTEPNFDDKPLGKTQILLSSDEFMSSVNRHGVSTANDEIEDLRRKARTLELLYGMSKTLTKSFDLAEIFNAATEIIFELTPADRVVALLKKDAADIGQTAELHQIAAKARTPELAQLTEKLTISRTITNKVMTEAAALLSQDARTDKQLSGGDSIFKQGIRSTICAPLVTENGVYGALYADRLDPFGAFAADDLELISAIAANTAVAVESVNALRRLAQEEVVRANYNRFLPPYVAQQLLEKPESFAPGGEMKTVTVLFADIRGFTSFSEDARPARILELLNVYFSAMTEIIFAHGGTLDKFIGDGLMALFGAPTASDQDAENAVNAAIAMQKRLLALNEELKVRDFAALGVGMGLHTGEAVVGYVGSEKRLEYTAIGDTVNLSARLESNAAAAQILISEATAKAVGGKFDLTARPPLTVKNRVQPIALYEVQWNLKR